LALPTVYSVNAGTAEAAADPVPTTVLFNASGNNQLSTSGQVTSGSESGNVGGPLSGTIRASFSSLPLLHDLTPTNDEWSASMYLSGTGNVWMKVILETNTGILGEVDSGPVTLNGNFQRLLVFGDGFTTAIIPEDSTLTITYEVRGNTPANINMRWGEEATPSALTVEGDFVKPTDVRISDSGEVFDDDVGDYGRRNIIIFADIETKVDLTDMMANVVLWVKDGENEFEVLGAQVEGEEGYYTLHWNIEEVGNGSNISVVVAWLDSEGIVHSDSTVWEWVFPVSEQESLLSQEALHWLQLSTMPLLLVIAYWLLRRNRSFCSEDEKIDELDHRAFSSLIFSACCFFIAALNIMFFIINHHIRNLGAEESQIILHLGVLALVFGATGPFWGRIADRTGQRRRLVKMAGIGGIAMSLLMAPLGLWPFFVISVLLMALLGVQRLHFALASEWFPEGRGEAIGILYAFGYLATAAFAVINGSIYSWLGIWATCITSAVLIAIGTISFLRIDIDRIDRAPESATLPVATIGQILKFDSKWVKWCLLGAFLVAIPRGAVVLTSPRYIEVRGFDIGMTSLFESWAIIALIFLYVVVGWICDRHGAQRVLFASALGYGLLWSIFSMGLPPWFSVAIYLIPIVPLLLVSNDALLSKFTNLKERNRGIGMAGAAAYVGQALGIGLVVALMTWFESRGMSDLDVYHYAYRSNIPLFALAVIVTWWLARSMRTESISAGNTSDI